MVANICQLRSLEPPRWRKVRIHFIENLHGFQCLTQYNDLFKKSHFYLRMITKKVNIDHINSSILLHMAFRASMLVFNTKLLLQNGLQVIESRLWLSSGPDMTDNGVIGR